MSQDVQVIRAIHWRDAFPFTHIFRAFQIATHPSKLVLAMLALLLLYCGGRIFDRIWGAPIFLDFLEFQVNQVNAVARDIVNFEWVGSNGQGGIAGAIYNFLIVGPILFVGYHPLYSLVYGIYFVIIWAIF